MLGRAGPTAPGHHRLDGGPQQATRRPTVGQRLRQGHPQDRHVLARPAVLGAPLVPHREQLVAVEQRLCPLRPAGRQRGADHPGMVARREPQVEQFVGERVPDGQCLAHRRDTGVLPPPAESGTGRTRRLAPDDGIVPRRRRVRHRREAQLVGVGTDVVDQGQRARPVAGAQQPRDRQQRGLLRHLDPVGPAVQQPRQLIQPRVAEIPGEERAPLGRQPEPRGQVKLVRSQRPAGGRRARGEATAHHLRRHPRGPAGHRGARADGESPRRHPGQHRRPACGASLGALAGRRVFVREGGAERLRQLGGRVAGGDRHANVAGSAPAPSGISPVLSCLSYTLWCGRSAADTTIEQRVRTALRVFRCARCGRCGGPGWRPRCRAARSCG